MPDKRTFEQISPHAFEHPLDRTALSALQKVRGFDWVVRKFITAIGERRLRLFFLASAVRVNENQFPRINELFDEACRVLDIEQKPELFVSQNFSANATAIGVDRPFIIITSSLEEMLDDDELQCVLGHELGHILCGHALYTTVLLLLIKLWYLFAGIPGGIYAAWAILAGLLEWSRKAELSSDRAGLLVSQSLDVSLRVDMKLAGGKQAEQMSLDEFKNQAAEYEAGGDLLDGVLKLLLVMGRTHPFPVLRVADLQKWVDSGEYQQILDGNYERRQEGPDSSWLDSVKSAAATYKESFDSSRDPFLSMMRDLGNSAAAAGAGFVEVLRRFTSGTRPEEPDQSEPKDSEQQ